MAVSIDTVYQKVLALANKEQRGYITPQEFNLFADMVQKEIFEQYFYDMNQWMRQPGNQTAHSDMVDLLQKKIAMFELWAVNPNTTPANIYGDVNLIDNFPDFYKIIEVLINYHDGKGANVAEEMTIKEIRKYNSSPLTTVNSTRPYYHHYFNVYDRIKFYPWDYNDVNNISISTSYIRRPGKPNWAYILVSERPLYEASASNDFELHASEESELVYRILALAGIAIEKPQVTQTAASLQTAQVEQEKQ